MKVLRLGDTGGLDESLRSPKPTNSHQGLQKRPF